MLNAVAEILTGEKPPEHFEAKKTAALGAVETAREKFRDACLAAEDGDPVAVRRKNAASKELDEAEARVREIEAAAAAAQRQAAARAEKAAQAERQRRWGVVETHLGARQAAAEELQTVIGKFRSAFDRLVQESGGMAAASPSRLGSDGALTYPGELENLVRLEMVRAGFRWAARWPWSPTTIPPLVNRIADSNAYVAKIREGQ